jgi:hypothetical protein
VKAFRLWVASLDNPGELHPLYADNDGVVGTGPATTAETAAVCTTDPLHAPPVEGCLCGVYGFDEPIAALVRLREITSWLVDRITPKSLPQLAAGRTVVVLTRVEMDRTLPGRFFNEVRGGTCRLTEIPVPLDLLDRGEAERFAAQSSEHFGVPARAARMDWPPAHEVPHLSKCDRLTQQEAIVRYYRSIFTPPPDMERHSASRL